MILRFNYSVKIESGLKAKKLLLQGSNLMLNLAVLSLGPKGRNALLEYENKTPKITKDGVTIFNNINLKDKIPNMCVNLLKLSGNNSNIYSGDGTTTTTLLACELYKQSLRFIEMGYNPVNIKKGLDKCKPIIKAFLNDIKIEDPTNNQIKAISKVSSNNDSSIYELVYKALEISGTNGFIEIEPGFEDDNEIMEHGGGVIPFGCISVDLLNEYSIIDIKNPLILLYDGDINSINMILPSMELAKAYNKEIFLVTNNISDDVLNQIVFNYLKGIIKVSPIKIGFKGDYSKQTFEDLSILFNTKVYSNNDNDALKKPKYEDFGKAENVKMDKFETFFTINKSQNKENIELRIEEINKEIIESKNQNQKSLQMDRINRLKGKYTFIRIKCYIIRHK